MNRKKIRTLAEWLEKIETGQATLESAARARPDLAAELAELIETAGAVRAASAAAAPEAFRSQARIRILNRIGSRERAKVPPADLRRGASPIPELRRVFVGMAVVVGLIVLGVFGSIPVQNALPGDALYPGKLAMENLQLLSSAPSADAILQTRFASNRLTEIQLLIVQGRYEDIDAAVQGYEANIDRAVLALAEVAREDGAQTYPILKRIEMELNSYSATLTELLAFVPDGTQKVLARAIQASHVLSGESN